MMERKIMRGTTVILAPTADDAALERPVFAINWFNTRASWLYDLYNLVASRSLFAVGAKVLFKGHLVETISGAERDARRVLLVVNYPSGERFLDLLSGALFQATSVLRMLAVRDFSFAFNERVDGQELLEHRTQPFERGRAWAILHYSSDNDIRGDLSTLRGLAAASGIELFFASRRVARVETENGRGERQAVGHITDNVVLFEARTQDELRGALLREGFRDFVGRQRSSYIGLLDRAL